MSAVAAAPVIDWLVACGHITVSIVVFRWIVRDVCEFLRDPERF